MGERTRIKICGITRPEDGRLAARLGADAVGLVFYPGSPRYVSPEQARAIVAVLPPFVAAVGLFLDADAATVAGTLESVSLDLLQFHGRESSGYCESFGRRYVKSVPMMDRPDLHAYTASFPGASGFLLDAVSAGQAGGRGERFGWEEIPRDLAAPLILAGGLTPDNVGDAVAATRCYAVDVSSGVEAEKGVKSPDKMQRFIEQVRNSE